MVEQLYASALSTSLESKGLELYVNLSGDVEEEGSALLIEYFVEWEGAQVYHNSRRVILNSWMQLKPIMRSEFIDDFFNNRYVEPFSKEDLIRLTDQLFTGYYKNGTDPLFYTAVSVEAMENVH